MNKNKSLVVIDGDYLCYLAASALETKKIKLTCIATRTRIFL